MDDRYSSKLSPVVDYGAGAFLLVVAMLTLVGNVLVLITAFKRRRYMKPPELLSVNLAVTDLGAALTMYPLAIASSWSHRWVGGHPACLYYGLMGFLFGVASIATLAVMAVVRFIVSLSVQSPKEKISKRSVHVLVACTWLYGLLWALLPLLGWGQYGPEPFGTSCTLAWGDLGRHGPSFVFAVFSLVLVLPAAVIIACYFGLALKLRLAYRSINNSGRIPNVVRTQRKLVLIAVLVSAGFVGSWTPYSAVSLWSAFHPGDALPAVVALLPCLFAKSSTVFNPLVYYLFSNTFRTEVRSLLWACRQADALADRDDEYGADDHHRPYATRDRGVAPRDQNGGGRLLPPCGDTEESRADFSSLAPAAIAQSARRPEGPGNRRL
ncbi:opsin 8, group member b [Anguilla rostrata]|uniref:opsin 8, group member b n=1 Tax=Anguilla rostrata TaxID=7938 RepID=UPI0030D14751